MDNKFVIIADATCDLGLQFQKDYDIVVVQGHYTTPDGEEHTASQSWSEEERDQFYKDLKRNPDGYKTSPPSSAEFYFAFEKYASQGIGILAMCISSGISGTHDFMLMAQKQIKEKYHDAKVRVVDSLRFGPGFGLMTLYASDLRKEGKSLDEVADWLEENKNRFHQSGWMDDLYFVAKKGRLTNAKAFFGSLVGVKPVGEFDYNGLTTVVGKGKGEKETYQILLEYIDRHIIDPQKQIIFIATSNRHKQAYVFKEMIENRFHPKAVYVNDVYKMCGVNVGPGLMAAYYYGKPISKGLVEETAAFNEIVENIRKK